METSSSNEKNILRNLSSNEKNLLRNYTKATDEQLSTLLHKLKTIQATIQEKMQNNMGRTQSNIMMGRTKSYIDTTIRGIETLQYNRKPFYRKIFGGGGKTRRRRSRSRSRRTRRR